ncbi:MAG: OmpH family outer membrane protein [Prevotellaceae bacterium]|jgi:outer membrane protein|nr:OmpH family outer membrane protein [Prevotellaceae bacterium]
MKNNLPLIFNVVLGVAVIVLFILTFSKSSGNEQKKHVESTDSICTTKLPVAYINTDSLLLGYQFAKDANEALIKEQENSRLTINTKARQLQNEMGEFQRKLENNAFLSRQRAEDEQTRLMKKQQDLQDLDARLTQELMQKQQKMSEQLRDTINLVLKSYNADHKYQLILSNTSNDNILYADEAYDITGDVIALLNKRWSLKK